MKNDKKRVSELQQLVEGVLSESEEPTGDRLYDDLDVVRQAIEMLEHAYSSMLEANAYNMSEQEEDHHRENISVVRTLKVDVKRMMRQAERDAAVDWVRLNHPEER